MTVASQVKTGVASLKSAKASLEQSALETQNHTIVFFKPLFVTIKFFLHRIFSGELLNLYG